MAATRSDIKRWFEEGVSKGHIYMVVVCDTFDHDDYPCYADSAEEALKKKNSPGDMQRVTEVYDLTKNMEEQLNLTRAMAL